MNIEITADQIEKDHIIVDQMGDKILVTEAWADQGPGLGIVVKGIVIEDGRPSHNRYLDGRLPVRQIGRK